MDRSLTENKRHLLAMAYFCLFRKHFLSTIPDSSTSTTKFLLESFYKKYDLWNTYPLAKTVDGRDLLFIHIPKCAGTSVANAFDRDHLAHYPAALFCLLNPEHFSNSESFTIVRNPADRIASILCHCSRKYVTSREIQVAQNLKLQDENLRENVLNYLTDDSFRFKLFNFTQPGGGGFSVNQIEYISMDSKIIVHNLFSFSHIKELNLWLSEKLGETVKIPHSNSSNCKIDFSSDDEIQEAVKKRYPRAYKLNQMLLDEGGFILRKSKARQRIDQIFEL